MALTVAKVAGGRVTGGSSFCPRLDRRVYIVVLVLVAFA